MPPCVRIPVLLIFFSCLLPLHLALGQQADNVLLTDYLETLEKKQQITFLYDSDLLEGVKAGIDTAGLSLNEALSKLEKITAFSFKKKKASIFQVIPVQGRNNLKIQGTLYDKETHETLPGASIVNGNGVSATITDENGNFTLYFNLQESDSISFYYFGYIVVKIPVGLLNGTNSLMIFLEPSVRKLAPIVIRSYLMRGVNYNLQNQSIDINPHSLGFLAGETDSDILLALDALPGISAPNTKAGNLVIRGATTDQTLIRFDNIPIYHQGHYFGMLSPYNPWVVQNVNVQRSGYMADKGGRVGGAIDIKSDNSIPDSATYGVGVSTINASAYTKIPIVKNKVGLILGGRTSLPINSPKLKSINNFLYQLTPIEQAMVFPNMALLTNKFRFNDCNVKLIIRPSKNDRLNVSFLQIHNNAIFKTVNYSTKQYNYDRAILSNWGYNLEWIHSWSQNFSTNVKITQSYYSQSYLSQTTFLPDSLLENATYQNAIKDINLNISSLAKLSNTATLNFGYNLKFNNQLYVNKSVSTGQPDQNLENEKQAFLHSGFGNLKLSDKKRKVIFNTGIRLNYYSITKKLYPEPRAMATYFLNDVVSLKGSAGIYNQYLMQIPGVSVRNMAGLTNLLWLLADGKKIPVVHSRQFMLGGAFQKKSWVIDIESYYRKVSNMSINNFSNFNSPNQYIQGSESTIGIDLLIKKSLKNIDAWVSYTLSKTEMQFDSVQGGQPFPGIWNQTHILDVVFAYKWNQFKFSLTWKYRSGLSALPFRDPYLLGPPYNLSSVAPHAQVQSLTFLPGSAEKYTDKFPAYHQTDLSIVYTYPKKKKGWNGTIGLSILNVFNKKNIIRQMARREPNGVFLANVYAIGFSPNLTATLSW